MIDQMPDDFEILQGKGFVMLSAPHGVEHTRAGRVKPAEVQTERSCTRSSSFAALSRHHQDEEQR